MKINIIYHSSTGNTYHCVKRLVEEFSSAGHQCRAVKVGDAEVDVFGSCDLAGVAFPVYGFRPAHNVLEFLKHMEPAESVPAFIVACCSLIDANSLSTAARCLSQKDLSIIAGCKVRGEEGWPAVRFKGLIIGRGRPDEQDDQLLRAFAREVLQKYEQVESGETVAPPRFKRLSPWGLIGRITSRQIMRYAMLGKFLDEERCTKCGLCADVCPTGSITLNPFPVFAKTCMGCFACVNLCPEDAVSTPLTWGRVRYKGHRSLAI